MHEKVLSQGTYRVLQLYIYPPFDVICRLRPARAECLPRPRNGISILGTQEKGEGRLTGRARCCAPPALAVLAMWNEVETEDEKDEPCVEDRERIERRAFSVARSEFA
jgi:hypothetical protein